MFAVRAPSPSLAICCRLSSPSPVLTSTMATKEIPLRLKTMSATAYPGAASTSTGPTAHATIYTTITHADLSATVLNAEIGAGGYRSRLLSPGDGASSSAVVQCPHHLIGEVLHCRWVPTRISEPGTDGPAP